MQSGIRLAESLMGSNLFTLSYVLMLMIYKHLRYRCSSVFVLMMIFWLMAAGCGSDDGDDTGSALASGRFVDSPVEGLRYQTETHDGVTDARGIFYYQTGETIRFYIGDLPLGEAKGKSILTPVDLVAGADRVAHPHVENRARFLQSLDHDGDPVNGITITPEIRQVVSDYSIVFDVQSGTFENGPDLAALLDSLNRRALFSDGAYRFLVPGDAASDHLRRTLAELTSDRPSEDPNGGDGGDSGNGGSDGSGDGGDGGG